MSVQDAFNQFCKERVRGVREGYTELVNEKVYLKELFKAYNRWCVCSGSGAKKIERMLFESLCNEAFGDSRGKQFYCHIRVFLDEDDLEDFEKESAIRNPNPITYPSPDVVPSLVMANHIVNSENKIELVRGLIEDKRALSVEVDELEEKVTALETRENSSTILINHLLKKITDLANKQAEVKRVVNQ
jgi:hypothetical protein